MATSQQIKALLKSHRDGDDNRFYTIAMQMAAHSAKIGHVNFAKEIRDLVDAAKAKTPSEKGNLPTITPELSLLINKANPDLRISDMVLDAPTKAKLLRVILEQRQQHKFTEYGLNPRRKLLLVGPPGTGKTMTASVLAGELNLPLYTILLDGLISKFLGETASKLRVIFDAMKTKKGVYLFDEFDALGARRASENEVGEIRRILNSFLQFLEQENSGSIILAATNHMSLLDNALFRRFDDVVEYKLPNEELILEILKNRLHQFNSQKIEWAKVVKTARELSYGDIAKAAEEAAKESILQDTQILTTVGLQKAMCDRQINR